MPDLDWMTLRLVCIGFASYHGENYADRPLTCKNNNLAGHGTYLLHLKNKDNFKSGPEISMGSSCSCNDTWCNTLLKLKNNAERRKERRRGCTCILRRPRFLRFRRKVHRGKCTCTNQLSKPTKCSQSPRNDFKDIPHKIHICSKHKNTARTGRCTRGTDTCFFQSSDNEIQGYQHMEANGCCPRGTQNKNVCRFTVDAYFT